MNKKYIDQVLKRASTEFFLKRADTKFSSSFRLFCTPELALTSPIKSSIQLIAELITQNKLKPCTRCEKDGVSMGYVRKLDAAGSLEYEECPKCEGWTVVNRGEE